MEAMVHNGDFFFVPRPNQIVSHSLFRMVNMRKYLLHILIISIFPLILFTCSLASAQSHQLADEYLEQAEELKEQGRYLEAARMFEKSAQAEKASPNPRRRYLSSELNAAGYSYYLIGQYDKAIKYYKETLAIVRKYGPGYKIAISLNNVGSVYKSWGQYDEAIKYYEKALVHARKLEREDLIANFLNNIGIVYDSWGHYDKAIEYYEEALAVNEKLDMEADIALNLHNIGMSYNSMGQFDIAIEYCDEALTIDKEFGEDTDIARDLNGIGTVYESRGQYDKAIYNFEEALAIEKRLGRKGHVAVIISNIGTVYSTWEQYDKAIGYYEEALAFTRELGMEDDINALLNNIGMLYGKQKQYKTAIKYFTESVSIIEKLRKTATGDVRRNYLASQLNSYQSLAYAYIKKHDASLAFQTIERSRAKLLAERLVGDESLIKQPTIKQIQETLDKDTVILVYANAYLENILQIAITMKEITGKDVPMASFVQSTDKYDTPMQTLYNNQRRIREANYDFEIIINFYRSLLKGQRGLKKNLRESPEIMKANTRELGRGLYDLLIKPMEAQLKNKTNLIIVPDGILSFVPFETLINEKGRYLVENYNISYIQSMGIRKLIKERKYREDRKPLLAFGGAVYDEKTYNKDMKMRKRMNATQLASLKKQIYSDIERKKSVRDAYSALGIDTWTNLPGTLREVDKIKQVIKRSDIFRDVNVTERNVKEFSRNGTLSRYKVVHFATHGLIVPEVPELSAVVLSQFKDNTGKEDGYLRMGEIAELDIRADFVNLSACETGLGKIYGGEGVVGLTQSFILAGANAVSVSLWSVADKSTSLFMESMYKEVNNKKISYSNAITEVKRQFIKGEFGETYKKPYYWAPFVYYGN